LTLLELVVVLVILMAVAGILVPLLPGMLGRAHTAEHGTNINEVNKAVEGFNIVNRGYPDNLDLLAPSTVLPGYAAGGGSGSGATACGGELITDSADLTADELAALTNAGISHVWTPTGTELVTAPYGAEPTATTLSTSSRLGILSTAARLRLYNEPTANTSKYVVFGLGPRCDMVGRPGGVPEAPLHFADERGTGGDPNRTYSRYGLVFRISDSAGVALERAQFVGALALHEGELSGANAASAEYHRQNPQ
jgi:type II secretory pathway pseudopilin PulG